MPATIVRFYEDEQRAASAVGGLEGAGFAAKSILHVEPLAADAAARARAADMAEHADAIGLKVGSGLAAVAIRPPFGQGKLATALLDHAGPVVVEMPAPVKDDKPLVNDPTPLSDKLGWPVLSKSATPLSDMFGWPTKTKSRHFLVRNLATAAAPLSSSLGLRLLSSNPAPLSTLFGLRVLSDKAAPLSDKFGWRTKAEKRLFLTSELSKNPTPLSSSLGLKVLSD